MRFPFAVSAIAVVAIAVAACTGSPPSTFITPPSGSTVATGAVTLGASATQSAGTAGGDTGVLTYVGGSGSVTATSSSTAPAGTTTVSPVSRLRVDATSPTSPNVYYVTITSAAGATLSGLPAVELALTTAAIGTFQEARFSGTTWTNVNTSAPATNPAGTAISFPPTSTAITIPAGGSIFLAFYQGTFPQPTAVPTNVLADSNFESGTAAAYLTPPTSTGWTQCAVTAAASNAGPIIHPFSTFTPTPGATPGATISVAGTTIPQGSTRPPTPSENSVLVVSGTHAAVLGGLFDSTFRQADLSYNGLCQNVKVPANPSISMQILGTGNETSSFVDFDVNVLDTTGKYLANVYDEQIVTASSGGDTAYRSVSVPSGALAPFAGQNVEIFIGIWTKSGGAGTFSGYYFVDDFLLLGNP